MQMMSTQEQKVHEVALLSYQFLSQYFPWGQDKEK